MQYFGVPTCPYCKKRVNLIRTWSLKRQGEYKCPRCGGISNIFLSPLIYVFAVIAALFGGITYFFHKFILDDISLSTTFQVFLPFAIFFALSLFLVYLKKPVIKKVPKSQLERKKRRAPQQLGPENREAARRNRAFADAGDYTPKMEYQTGPLEQLEAYPKAFPERRSNAQGTYEETAEKTAVIERLPAKRPSQREKPVTASPSAYEIQRRAGAREEPAPRNKTAVNGPMKREAVPEKSAAAEDAVTFYSPQEPKKNSRVVSSIEIPETDGDFFAKYDDPAYIEKRLKEIEK